MVNTTLQAEVQTISRQMYAILVVKLEGKALGIVQLVGKGEGLFAGRQLKLEYEGKSGNRQAALMRGILNPRALYGRLSLGDRVAEQVGEDHQLLSDSQR